jgi:hypothetical protein
MTFNDDGSITFRKSYGIGRGLTITKAVLDALWVDEPPATASAEYFQPGEEDTDGLVANVQVKGTMQEEARKRAEHKEARTEKYAAQKQAQAQSQQDEQAELRKEKSTVTCPDCGKEVSTARGGLDKALSRHKAQCGVTGVPDRHRFECCVCGEAGHMSPADKRCKAPGNWGQRGETEQKQCLKAAVADWKR